MMNKGDAQTHTHTCIYDTHMIYDTYDTYTLNTCVYTHTHICIFTMEYESAIKENDILQQYGWT